MKIDKPFNENEEANDHQRLNYISNEHSKENQETNDRDYMIGENKQNTSEISQGTVKGKKWKILRDTGGRMHLHDIE